MDHDHWQIQRGVGGQGFRTPLKNHKNIGFFINTGLDPLKNHEATKPAFNVGPDHRYANDGPLIVVFVPSLPSSTKKNQTKIPVKFGPPLTKLSGSSHNDGLLFK